jgi:hypothetical protein
MDTLGLGPVPKSLFETQQVAIGTLATITTAIKTMGAGATVGEILGASMSWEIPVVLAGLSAAAYGGGIAGSLLVAESKDLFCGNDLFDAIRLLKKWGVDSFWSDQLAKHPEVYQQGHPGRASYGMKSRIK